MIDKSEAARRQIECAIRLVAAQEDELAVHTLAMAAFGILNDPTAPRTDDYDLKFKPYFTAIGWSHLTKTANFLKHANRDPEPILDSLDARENDWRIGFCLLLYRSLRGTLTPTMAAFHTWMVTRYPDQFQLAEDDDKDFEAAYRDSQDEVNKAYAEERERKETVLFPIRLDDVVMTTAEPWAGKLRDQRHIGDFRQWKEPAEYQKSLERLLRDLKTSAAKSVSLATPK
jgi:hypothetical protein